jgi:hypothetical protein
MFPQPFFMYQRLSIPLIAGKRQMESTISSGRISQSSVFLLLVQDLQCCVVAASAEQIKIPFLEHVLEMPAGFKEKPGVGRICAKPSTIDLGVALAGSFLLTREVVMRDRDHELDTVELVYL